MFKMLSKNLSFLEELLSKVLTIKAILRVIFHFCRIVSTVFKTLNRLENGLANGLNKALEKHPCITVAFLVAHKS